MEKEKRGKLRGISRDSDSCAQNTKSVDCHQKMATSGNAKVVHLTGCLNLSSTFWTSDGCKPEQAITAPVQAVDACWSEHPTTAK